MKKSKSMVTRVHEYLAFRRSLGYQLKIEGGQLLRFAHYAEENGHRGPLTIELALRWARLPKRATPLYWARRLEVVRPFARYLAAFDSNTEIPPNHLLGPAHRRTQPHIYSPCEIKNLMRAASQLAPDGGLRAKSFRTFIGLLASTGLRPSEALKLERKDVDLEKGLLTIRETKFHKSRLVPLHDSTTRALATYARHRDANVSLPESPTFLLDERGRRLRAGRVHWTFRKLRKGLRASPGRRPPRLYDLRHTFATRVLLQAHLRGKDVHEVVPVLSTYLGHVKPSDTYWYLSGIPELFAVVGAKFERYARSNQGDHL